MIHSQNNNISETIKDKINASFEKLYHKNEDGEFQPFVCVVCDKVMKHMDTRSVPIGTLAKNQDILSEQPEMKLHPDIKQAYTLPRTDIVSEYHWLTGLLLSPRAPYFTTQNSLRSEGFACCRSCLYGLDRGQMPKFAIANGYFFGTPPTELTELTMVERAMLTPVKTGGFCFTYTGGRQTGLQGSMTYYKSSQQRQMKGNLHLMGRNHASITKAVAKLDALGLNTDIVTILHGWMTPEQKRAAKKHNTIRVDKVLLAVKWLVENNQEWTKKELNYDKIRQELETPIIIDKAKHVDPSEDVENQNIEKTETFHVYFPDGTMTDVSGGQETMAIFRDIVKEKKLQGFDASIQWDLQHQYVYDYKDNNFVNACLLQFPYGRGGLDEHRIKGDGSATITTDIGEYINQLSYISQKYFHEELFCLQLYNMDTKNMMLKTASWRVRGGVNSAMIGQDLTQQDVESAVSEKRTKRYISEQTNTPGGNYIRAIDTTAQKVPHTNQAAKRAKASAEAIQVEHGQPSWFLTVTPDDDHCFLLQVYSRTDIDLTSIDMANISESEAVKRSQQRTTLRIQFPGISALYFEDALDIVIKDVVGWDAKAKKPLHEDGLFGTTEAFSATIEEQGRGTLHVHLLIWSESFNDLRKKIHNPKEAKTATLHIKRKLDKVVTTNLVGPVRKIPRTMTPHVCTRASTSHNKLPTVCADNILRFLRHQKSYKKYMQQFATCELCTTTWTDMDITRSYLKNVGRIDGINENIDLLSSMKSKCLAYQAGVKDVDESVVHAAYDKHVHTKSCFRIEKTPKGQRKTKGTLRDYECRFRFPRRPKPMTELKPVSDQPIRWYMWDGSYVEQKSHEINIKRSSYDVFQNESCVAIAKSKMACNTNLTGLLPGPIAAYAFKYNMKGTQDDDEKCYERVLEATKKSLALTQPERTTYCIAVSRLLRASIAHQKTNVIRGTLASFLTRHKTRFIFSHESVWCPVSDLKKVLRQEKAFSTIQRTGNTPFFECNALNYICRPTELEEICPFEFYAKYVSVKLTKNVKKTEKYLSFINLYDRKHPSFNTKKGEFLKCVQEKETRTLVKFSPYFFPDTAQIGGNLFEPTSMEPNEITETYCGNLLTLFHHYRRLEDIQIDGSHYKKVVFILQTTGFDNQTKKRLQNIQDYRSNATRYRPDSDDLQRCTVPYTPTNVEHDTPMQTEAEAMEEEINLLHLQEILQHIENEDDNSIATGINKRTIPDSLSLVTHINRAKYLGGTRHIATMYNEENISDGAFIIHENQHAEGHNPDTNNIVSDDEEQSCKRNSQSDFVHILMTRTSRRKHPGTTELKQHVMDNRLEANGSLKSIMDWGKCAKFDAGQRRAFEIFTASFIMTFYREAKITGDGGFAEFITEHNNLMKLLETESEDHQLICFLHGPAGSGKSTVIDIFMEYAREFCAFIPGFVFTPRTVTITAMSGVAATLIGGETTHKALYMNKTTSIGAQEIEEWAETRMLVIDEISFASTQQLKTIHSKLAALKQNKSLPYGGINIIFAGDMRQLEPCPNVGKPIYDEYCLEFEGWVNCYIALRGMHRFREDLSWGHLLKKFRDGKVTKADIATVNTRVVKNHTTLPDNIRYATYYNKDRDSINAALFEKHCAYVADKAKIAQDAIIIFSDKIEIQNHNKEYVDLKNCLHFWETCGECDVQDTARHGRMDPVLKLYMGCNVMFPFNRDVSNGIANGTQGTVQQVHLNYDTPRRYVKLKEGIKVQAVYAKEIKGIDVRHTNKDIQPSTFTVEPRTWTIKINMLKPLALQSKNSTRENVNMKCNQIPLIINNATTGHKLQGVGVKSLFIHEWQYRTNWPYVVLSRVKTMNGLYLRRPLKDDPTSYNVPPKLTSLLQHLEGKAPTYWTVRDYRTLCRG